MALNNFYYAVDPSDDSSSDEDYVPPSQTRRRNRNARRLNDDEDEDSLPSVGNNEEPESHAVESTVQDGDASDRGESNSDSLPSIGEVEGDTPNARDLSLPNELHESEDEDGNAANSDSDNLPSVGNEEDREEIEENVDFPARVSEDGEEAVEFASENEELSEESEDDPSWYENIGVEPAVPFDIPNEVVNDIASRVLTVRHRRSRPTFQQDTLHRSRGQRVEREASPAGPSSAPRRQRRSTKPRRKRKAAKKKTPRKSQPRKPVSPPKPLGPLTIYEDWDGNDSYKNYQKILPKSAQFRVNINVQEQIHENVDKKVIKVESVSGEPINAKKEDESMEEDVDFNVPGSSGAAASSSATVENSSESNSNETFGYKIAQVKFDRCSTHEWKWRNKSELLEAFPNIISFTLHVNSEPGASVLYLKAVKTVRGEEEISQRLLRLPKLNKRDAQRELICVGTEHYFFHIDPVEVPADLFSIKGLGNRKIFCVDFNKFDMERQQFYFDIILLDSAIIGEHDIHEIPASRSTILQEVFSNFLGVVHPPAELENEAREKEDIEWFYGQIKKYHTLENLPSSDILLQPSSLKPTLRKYQRDAVQWMLYREGCLNQCTTNAHSSTSYQNRVDLAKSFLEKMYTSIELTTPVGRDLVEKNETEKKLVYYNVHTGYLCWVRPKIPPLPSGGILCDEMGLGKTVETLSLILLNQKKVPKGEPQEEQEDNGGNEDEKVKEVDSADPDGDFWVTESESEIDIPSDSSAESLDSTLNSKKRKKNGGGGENKRSKVALTSPSSRSGLRPRYQNTKRKRAASPCEFTAAEGEPEMAKSPEPNEISSLSRRRSSSKRITIGDHLEKKIKSIKRTRQRMKKAEEAAAENEGDSESQATSPPKQKRPALFEAMKVLYDSALSEYRYADYAKSTPKFHGKFYETGLDIRAFFECICGESDEACNDWEIVKCTVCSSSQHAECVGFDEELMTVFSKLGRGYLCPHCEALNKPPFESKSTLIITPPSISHQWIKEIQRHVQNHRLNILFYKGITTHGYIPPAKLARYDLVITTYSVLSTELDYVDLPHCNSADGRRFRNAKRFLTIPSPLPSVLWWRVCLDEAQMVEGINTKMSMMAMKFQAVHRWCVTGTPMNKGLQDLFGLFVFLQVYPISYDVWWNALVRDAFYRKETNLLYELFGQMIWRNGKQDVLDQLGIPPQTEISHWLNFSPVETHFYKQQFEICSNRIVEKIERLRRLNQDVNILDARLTTLDRSSLNGLLSPFLELRQACCHPQIVKGHVISMQKGPLTMEDLLDRLMKKTQLQCVDDHRLIVAALNGMSGLYIIQNNFKEAAEKYREVLQSAEKHKEDFKTDSLQLLHTVENLAEILDANHDGIPFTLRDDKLRQEGVELRMKYMEKYANAVKASREAVAPLSNLVDDTREQFTMHKESWWIAALKASQRIQKGDSLIQTLKQDLLDVTKKHFHKSNSIANKFHDRWSLERALIPILLEMEQLRDTVLSGLEELETNDPSSLVDSAIRCHLRQKSGNYYNDSNQEEDRCKLCMYHDNFLLYESVIFKMEHKDKISRTGRNWQQNKMMGQLAAEELELTEKTKEELLQQEAEDLRTTTEHVQLINDELRRGHWGDSETEVILKGILRFARTNKLTSEIGENGQVHMKLFEALKKEFRFLRVYWRQIYDQVSALDELSQATTRMVAVEGNTRNQQQPSTSRNIKQLRSDTADKAMKIQNIHVIGYHEIEPKLAQMRLDYLSGQETLSVHLGQLLYLKTLKKNGYGKKGSVNTEDCPICSVQLGKEWSVLRCGHSFCSECVKKMCPNTLIAFLCPLCRHSMKYADVSFVDTTKADRMTDEPVPGTSKTGPERKAREIKGSHSTKVEAIVETLLDLQDKHPGEKSIIFSMWTEVLEIIARALDQNDIKYSLLTQSGRQFHQNLDKFKEREDLQVLLMPLTSGAKGLNIIEATHVLLVEPILNLASELQAIGRVHRIGQTKPTFVHRFYIKRTIEEKLFQILKGQDISSDEEGCLTVKDLQNLVSTTSTSTTSAATSTK